MTIANIDNGNIEVTATMERGVIMTDFGRKALHRQLDQALDRYYVAECTNGIDIPTKWMKENRYGEQQRTIRAAWDED